jgi:hypothetical protein
LKQPRLYSRGKIVEIGIVELEFKQWRRIILFDEVCYEKGIT